MNILSVLKKHGFAGSLKLFPKWLEQHRQEKEQERKLREVRLTEDEVFVIKEVQGSRMLLNLNDAGISRELCLTGVHEPESTKQYVKELKSGMTIFELGANVGYYALLGAKVIGETGKIIAFEPSPVNMENFRLNVVLNNLEDRVESYQMGIGSSVGILKFNVVNKGNMSSFFQRKEDGVVEMCDTIDVPVTTVDAFIENNPCKIDYMRMDVEGFEVEIFKGMKNFLKSEYAPEGFFIEIHCGLLNENNTSCREFVENLSSYDYEISIARWRGIPELSVNSIEELLRHELCEIGYWEAFFTKI
ncbi:MAG: FkbM family methyltransferase [bacterium]